MNQYRGSYAGKVPDPACSHFHFVWIPYIGLLVEDVDSVVQVCGKKVAAFFVS